MLLKVFPILFPFHLPMNPSPQWVHSSETSQHTANWLGVHACETTLIWNVCRPLFSVSKYFPSFKEWFKVCLMALRCVKSNSLLLVIRNLSYLSVCPSEEGKLICSSNYVPSCVFSFSYYRQPPVHSLCLGKILLPCAPWVVQLKQGQSFERLSVKQEKKKENKYQVSKSHK